MHTVPTLRRIGEHIIGPDRVTQQQKFIKLILNGNVNVIDRKM